jgi:N-sulfoglucosamine sulfohydrolase
MKSTFPACLAAMLSTTAIAPGESAAAKPNFVIFIADDMAWDDSGAYGHPTIHTPNIDRLAREGMRFDQAWLTASSCSPSRASILTGRYPHATGAGELHLPWPDDAVLMTTPLREAGYWAASVGKWHPRQGDAGRNQFDLVNAGGGPSGCGDWVEVLQNRPPEKPFFLWLAASDPHRPYPPGAFDPPHSPDDVVVPPYLPDTPEVRRDLALYYDEIARLDGYVGQVLDELKAQDVLDNTFVLFISDNGRPFPRDKTTVYDSGLRTPFIVRYPPVVQAGAHTASLASAVDIAPTVLELAGMDPLPTFQGKSLMPVLRDPDAVVRTHAFGESNWHDVASCQRGIRGERFNYIRNYRPDLPLTPPADAGRSPTYQVMQKLHADGKLPPHQATCFVTPRPEEELYDTHKDPFAMNNLAKDPEFEPVMEEMRAALAAWQDETGDSVDPENITPDGFDRQTFQKLIKGSHPALDGRNK